MNQPINGKRPLVEAGLDESESDETTRKHNKHNHAWPLGKTEKTPDLQQENEPDFHIIKWENMIDLERSGSHGEERSTVEDSKTLVQPGSIQINGTSELSEESTLPSSSSKSPSSSDETPQTSCSSVDSSIPPLSACEIDRWHNHIRLRDFGNRLQAAARRVFPNDARSKYTSVTVLMLSWEDEDPNLPVSIEISKLFDVFNQVYGFNVERWVIPDQNPQWALTQKIMEFVRPGPDERSGLKIVYYAGHGRLTKTRALAWTSWRNKSGKERPSLQWSSIQVLLEQAESDVLILLDCCASGTASAGEGHGSSELISACAYNAIANGVGQYSFTNALVTELRALSRKPSFSVGELYSNIFIRTQSRLPEDGRERHPAPVHLILTREEKFPRSIQLSANWRRDQNRNREETQIEKATLSVPEAALQPDTSPPLGSTCLSMDPPETKTLEAPNSGSDEIASISKADMVPRIAFAVRLEDNFKPGQLTTDLMVEWLRSLPIEVRNVKVEAGFSSFSTLLIISLPISLASYFDPNSAVIPLGPVTSSNILLTKAHEDRSPECGISESRPLGDVGFEETMDLPRLPADFNRKENVTRYEHISNAQTASGFHDSAISIGSGYGEDKKVAPTSKRRLACPFYIHSLQNYKSDTKHGQNYPLCAAGIGFADISRVKEHLKRVHAPAHACPRCGSVFKVLRELKVHLSLSEGDGSECPVLDIAPPSTMAPDMMKKLAGRGKRGFLKSEEEKWFEIYTELFPNDSPVPPISAYKDDYIQPFQPGIERLFLERLSEGRLLDRVLDSQLGSLQLSSESRDRTKKAIISELIMSIQQLLTGQLIPPAEPMSSFSRADFPRGSLASTDTKSQDAGFQSASSSSNLNETPMFENSTWTNQ